jgi:hypothetical protein
LPRATLRNGRRRHDDLGEQRMPYIARSYDNNPAAPLDKAIGSRQIRADPKHTGKNNAKSCYVVE